MKLAAAVLAIMTTVALAAEARADEPGVCTAADAKLVEASTANASLKAAREQLRDLDAHIAALRADIAAERRNPAGVVDLRRLHDLGEGLQADIAVRPEAAATVAAWDREVKRLIPEATKLVKACSAARKAPQPPTAG